jgi:hypothetical protein
MSKRKREYTYSNQLSEEDSQESTKKRRKREKKQKTDSISDYSVSESQSSEESSEKSRAHKNKRHRGSVAKDGSIIVENDSGEISSTKSLDKKSGHLQTLQV